MYGLRAAVIHLTGGTNGPVSCTDGLLSTRPLPYGPLRQTGTMLTPTLARALRQAGLEWRPANGDRFLIAKDELDDDVFHLADMVVEAHDLDSGTILAFNGTTEWALDSVEVENTVWLPGEGQLRGLLGDHFRGLDRARDHVAVRLRLPDGSEVTVTDPDAECAYARALLRILRQEETR